MKNYDLIVLGGGAGGLTVAAGAASMGAHVALIEKERQPGGDCLHVGCVPSKALIEAAKNIRTAVKTADEFGFRVQGELNPSAVISRVKAAIAQIQRHDDSDRFRRMGVDVYHGFGRFEDEHRVEIEGEGTIYGKRIMISTGSRPAIPPIAGLMEAGYLTNETVFDLRQLPARLAVIGAGPIGLELAQSLARLGSEVTVIEYAPSLLGREDPEWVPHVQSALEEELTFLFDSNVMNVEKLASGEKKVTIQQGDKNIQLEVDDIPVATGRKPNTDQIGLEHTRVQVDNGYIAVKETLQTTVPHIYAIGDVLRSFPFTHAAGMEGKIVVSDAVFGYPEVYHLGWTEQDGKEKLGSGIRVYKVHLDDVDRFVTDRETKGMVKVITDRKGRILGAHAVGRGAGDWMQEIVFAKQYGHKIGSISNVIHPYPTHGAAVQQAADQYWRKKLFEGSISKLMKTYIRWFR